jgi:hypothetical protein
MPRRERENDLQAAVKRFVTEPCASDKPTTAPDWSYRRILVTA